MCHCSIYLQTKAEMRVLLALAIAAISLNLTVGFFDLPPTCSCEQLGATQGLSCQCQSVEGTFPEGFPEDVVKMTFNQCSLFSIPSGAFDGLELLSEIHFLYSKIVSIESGAFASLSQIDLISFRGSSWGDQSALITTIHTGAFTDLHFSRGTTDGLDNGILFENLKIGEIESNAFESITGMSQLSMRRSEISRVSDESFHGVENIVTFRIFNSNITNQLNQPFQLPVSFITFILNGLSTPVLSPFMIPSDSSEVTFSNGNVDTIDCGLFADGLPVEMEWEDNQVVCDCRLQWMFGDEEGKYALPESIIDSFTCKGPSSAIGNELSDYSEIPLPCSGVSAVTTCELYTGGGSGVPVLAIVLPIVFICIAIIVIVLAILMYRKYRKHERNEKISQHPPSKGNTLNAGTYKPTARYSQPPELPPPREGSRPISEGYYDLPDDSQMDEYADSSISIKKYDNGSETPEYIQPVDSQRRSWRSVV